MSRNSTFTNTLQLGNSKYIITKRLYQEIMAQTNYISDYNECKTYVMNALTKCLRETQKVNDFKTKKIDIEI